MCVMLGQVPLLLQSQPHSFDVTLRDDPNESQWIFLPLIGRTPLAPAPHVRFLRKGNQSRQVSNPLGRAIRQKNP